MALTRNNSGINAASVGVGLMVIETSSELRGPVCGHLKPYVKTIHGVTPDGTKIDYGMGFDNLIVTNETLVHLVSIPLTASTWTLASLRGFGLYYEQLEKSALTRGNLFMGNFNWVFNKQAGPFPPAGVRYLGHIKMKQRLRTSNTETCAGGKTPLIDQKLSRYRESTLDVEILDSQDADLRLFRRHYPSLNNVQVEKSLLH
jgi:hypothetical protein